MKIKLLITSIFSILMMSCSASKSKTYAKANFHKRHNLLKNRLLLESKLEENRPTYKTVIEPVKPKKETTTEASLADKIIWSAFKYRGVKYRYGGTSMNGIDCSALVMNAFKERGISLPRSSHGMSKEGYKISLDQAQRGDLIFFYTNPRRPRRVSHVGLVTHVLDNGVVQFIHASTKRGVILNKMNENYYKKNFAFVKRVL